MRVFQKLPRQVLIKDETYDVKVVKRPDNKKNLAGIIFFGEEIQICSDMSPDDIQSTLIHEIIHGISRNWGIRLCEVTVKKLEIGLYDVFKKNGWKIQIK